MREDFFIIDSKHATQSLDDIYSRIKDELEDYLFILEQYLNKKNNAGLLHKVKLAKKLSTNKSELLEIPCIQLFTIQLRNIFAKIEINEANNFSFTPKDCEVLSICIDDFTNTFSYQFEKTSVPSSAKEIKEINTVLDWGSPMAIQLIKSNFNKEVVTNLNKDEQEAWISVLSTAYKILERYTPKLFNEIFNGLSIIIPVHSKEKLTSLSSTPEYPNGVMLASIVPPNEMAEALVHEWSHNVLNLVMNENKLLLDDTFLLYSPFRDDARTPSGLLHAGFSFYNVCCLLRVLKSSDNRFSTWVDSKITGYLIKVEYCLELLVSLPDALTEEGLNFCTELLQKLKLIYPNNLSFNNSDMKEIKKHYETWKSTAKGLGKEISDKAFSKVIENKVKNKAYKKDKSLNYSNHVYERDLDFLRTNFKNANEPFVVRSKSLVNREKLLTELDIIKGTTIELIDSTQYKGKNDPKIKRHTTLGEYSDDISKPLQKEKISEFFVKTQFEKLLSNSIWKDDNFFNEFWFGIRNTWLFMNPRNCSVVLHYDNCNNLHCLVKGEKEFFLSPPSTEFYTSKKDVSFEDGFHQFNPFLNRKKASSFGSFINLKAHDMIYIPDGFWHAVNYKKDSISLSALDDINYTGFL